MLDRGGDDGLAEAPISGTSLICCSFGPALVSWNWEHQWIYAVAPPLGGVLGLIVFRLTSREGREVLTGKLFHAPNYRTIFKCGTSSPGS